MDGVSGMDNNIYISSTNSNPKNHTLSLIIKIVVSIIVLSVVLIILFFISTRGYLSVTSNNTKVSLSLVNQFSQKDVGNYTDGNKMLIKKNDYTLLVHSANKSYISSVNTKGFFQHTNVNAQLTPSVKSSVIATNPYQCTFTMNDIVYSHWCLDNSEYDGQNNQETSLKKQYFDSTNEVIQTKDFVFLSNNQKLLSLAQVSKNEVWMIIKTYPVVDDAETSQEPFIELRKYINGDFGSPIDTRSIDSIELGNIKPYQEGYVLYSKDSVTAYYLESFDSTMQPISFEQLPKLDDYGFDIVVAGDYITYYYKNRLRDSGSDNKPQKLSISSVYKLKEKNTYITNYEYTSAFVCQKDTLCIFLKDKSEFIIQNNSSRTLFKVSDYLPYKNKVILNMMNNVVIYDIETNSGFIAYEGSSDTNICGMQVTLDSIRTCVDSELTDDTYALQLDTSQSETVNLLHGLGVISKNNHVDYVSAIGNTIIINTNIIAEYNEDTKTYKTDASKKYYATKLIMQSVSDAGIDPSLYNIVIN